MTIDSQVFVRERVREKERERDTHTEGGGDQVVIGHSTFHVYIAYQMRRLTVSAQGCYIIEESQPLKNRDLRRQNWSSKRKLCLLLFNRVYSFTTARSAQYFVYPVIFLVLFSS